MRNQIIRVDLFEDKNQVIAEGKALYLMLELLE
jgi:hypothetical protein